MTGSGNRAIYVAVFAILTGMGGITVIGTGGRGYGFFVGVTQSVNYRLLHKHGITYRAMLSFGQTGIGTVGSNCIVDHLGVTKLILKRRTAHGTSLRGSTGRLSAGGMTQSVGLIRLVAVATG